MGDRVVAAGEGCLVHADPPAEGGLELCAGGIVQAHRVGELGEERAGAARSRDGRDRRRGDAVARSGQCGERAERVAHDRAEAPVHRLQLR